MAASSVSAASITTPDAPHTVRPRGANELACTPARTRGSHRSLCVLRAVCASSLLQMAEPKQKCRLSCEQLSEDGKKLEDYCPACKKLGVEVEVMFHKSRDAPPG